MISINISVPGKVNKAKDKPFVISVWLADQVV